MNARLLRLGALLLAIPGVLACSANADEATDDAGASVGGTQATGGTPATGGTTPDPDDPLAGADGITGTFDGVAQGLEVSGSQIVASVVKHTASTTSTTGGSSPREVAS